MIRKKNYPSIRKKLWGDALWSPSYFAGSCGGAPIAIIRHTLSSNRRRINRRKDAYGIRAILPRPEGRGLPRTWSICKILAVPDAGFSPQYLVTLGGQED